MEHLNRWPEIYEQQLSVSQSVSCKILKAPNDSIFLLNFLLFIIKKKKENNEILQTFKI
jgi:hypothetical protein